MKLEKALSKEFDWNVKKNNKVVLISKPVKHFHCYVLETLLLSVIPAYITAEVKKSILEKIANSAMNSQPQTRYLLNFNIFKKNLILKSYRSANEELISRFRAYI